MSTYAAGKKALGICDVCGFQYKLKQLKVVVRNRVPTGLLACPSCWDEQHPQEDLGLYRVVDAQSVRNPRPDNAEYAQSRGITIQVVAVVAIGSVESVGVTIT